MLLRKLKEVRSLVHVYLAAERDSRRIQIQGPDFKRVLFFLYYKIIFFPNSCYRNIVFCSWLHDFLLLFMALPHRSELAPSSFLEKRDQPSGAPVPEATGEGICIDRFRRC